MQTIRTTKVLILLFSIFSFLSCTNLNESKFSYFSEQFADLKILRYQIPGFENLSLDQKKLVYYLTEAGLSGRDIMYDQNYRHNLKIRRALENIHISYQGDKNNDQWKAFEIYLKRIWFSNGIHHHYSNDKFIPGFSSEYLQELLAETNIKLEKEVFNINYNKEDS